MGFFVSFQGFPETRPFDEDAMVDINMIRKSHDHFRDN